MRNRYIIKYILIAIILYVFWYYLDKEFNQLESFTVDSDVLYMTDSENPSKTKAILKGIEKYINIKDINSKALKFEGVKSFMILPNIDTIVFSLVLIIKTSLAKRQCIAYSISGNWKLEIYKSKCRFITNDEIISVDIPITTTEWFLISISVTDSNIKLFVNGTEATKSMSISAKTKHIILGNDKTKKQPFYGYIGGIKVNKAYISRDNLCNMYLDKVSSYLFKSKFCKEPPKPNILEKPKIAKCLFMPKGDTEQNCVSTCKDYDNCSLDYCQKVCGNCIDRETCKWIPPPPTPPVDDSEPNFLPPYPPEIKINAIESTLLVEWVRPYDGGTPITNYLVMVQESFNKPKGVKLSLAPDPNCTSCEYSINGLKPQTYYDVSVRAVNSEGMGKISNLVTVATKGVILNKDISSTLLESDDEILDKVKQQMNYGSQSCSNQDGHILDIVGNETLADFINNIYEKNK